LSIAIGSFAAVTVILVVSVVAGVLGSLLGLGGGIIVIPAGVEQSLGKFCGCDL